MHCGQYELSVAIPSGTKLTTIREYGHAGLTYVEGRKSQPFAVVVKNNTANRVLAVVTIDGLDVVDGKPGHAGSRGHIIEGYSKAIIHGWRTSLEEIKQFYFEEKTGSFVKGSTGSEANCGVIACKVIAEKVVPVPIVKEIHHHHDHYVAPAPYYPPPRPYYPYRPWWDGPVWTCHTGDTQITSSLHSGTDNSLGGLGSTMKSAASDGLKSEFIGAFMASTESPTEPPTLDCAMYASASSASSAVPDFTLGTGWGATQKDKITVEEFKRGAELATMSLYYSDIESLKKIGIVISKDTAINAAPKLPQGFGEFCRPPGVD